MDNYGVSVSIKQCRNFNISSADCLKWLMKECGFKRFRLMSYWDEIEAHKGHFDFRELDRQMRLIAKNNGSVSLCLGARQPRWPENHWPDWAWKLTSQERTDALLYFLEVVIKRYRNYACIVSYQLENEALLKSFGKRSEIDRSRLRSEFKLVKSLTGSIPVIMTTSTSWGIPVRKPLGDSVGFSFYQVHYSDRRKAYTTAHHMVWLHKFRKLLVHALLQRESFIHELQLEPWGPKNIWEMSIVEQMKSMSPAQIRNNIRLARRTGLNPIDLWGGEWWYWSYKTMGNTEIINTILKTINQ